MRWCSTKLREAQVRLVRRRHSETVLAAQAFPWSLDQAYALALQVEGSTIRASIDGKAIFEVQDSGSDALVGGAIALMVDTGSVSTQEVRVTAL